MKKLSQKMIVTAVFDKDLKVYSAYFDELPKLLVQGNSVDDVKVKLTSLLQSYIKRLQSIGNDFEVITKNFV